MAKQLRWVFWATLTAFAVIPTLHAAQEQGTLRTLADEPGKWKPWRIEDRPTTNEVRAIGATAADVADIEARLKQIADILRSSPVWNSPKGVDPLLSGSTSVPLVKKTSPPTFQAVAGSMLIGSFEHFEIAQGKEPYEHAVGGETMFIQLAINLLPPAGGGIRLDDEAGAFMKERARTEDIGGFPTYGDLLVITPSAKPLWLPVSRERYLNAFIAKRRTEAATADASIVDQQKKLDAFLAPDAVAARKAKYAAAVAKAASQGAAAAEHERRYWERDEADSLAALTRGASRDPKVSRQAATIAGLKAAQDQLAAMSSSEKGGPACYVDASADPAKSGLVPMGTAGCAPIVSQNQSFFDSQLPRGAAQIVTVSRFRELEKTWKDGRPVNGASSGQLDLWTTYEVFRTTDWHTVEALIGK